MAARASWARTTDRAARTEPARKAADQRFLKLADGDPKRAEGLRRAHLAAMLAKSNATHRAQKAAREAAKAVHT
jgi:hypothetical protein